MGGQERRNRLRRHLGEHPLDERESKRVADSLRAALTHYSLQLSPSASLSRMIVVAERAAREGVLRSQDEEQVRLLGQAQHVADCLERFRQVDDQDQVVAWLRKSLDRINSPGSEGLDRLLEIEVAGRLAAEGMFRVATTEPDVEAITDAGPLTCACKHPDTLRGAADRILEGAKQVEQQGHIGLVVVSLDSVFHEPGKFLGVKNPDEATEWGKARLDVAERDCGASIRKVWRTYPHVAGVIFLLSVPYVSEGPPRTTGSKRVARALSTPGRPGASGVTSLVARVLIAGLTDSVSSE